LARGREDGKVLDHWLAAKAELICGRTEKPEQEEGVESKAQPDAMRNWDEF